MSRPLPTIAQLPPTGLDRGVRMLIVKALDPSGRGMILPTTVVSRFFSGNWSDLSDYLEGLDRTGQNAAAEAIRLTRDSKMPTRNEESARPVLTYSLFLWRGLGNYPEVVADAVNAGTTAPADAVVLAEQIQFDMLWLGAFAIVQLLVGVGYHIFFFFAINVFLRGIR